jgi:excisionase family DNA binding protein
MPRPKRQLPMPDERKLLLTVEEAAAVLDVSENTVRRMIESSQLDSIKGGPPRRLRRVRRSEVERVLDGWQREAALEREDAEAAKLTGGAA